jgi:chromosomal replication initiation ATPase DnaA
MEEIEQLLTKLKQDQEALYNNFKQEVLIAYSEQYKEYKHKSFDELKNIIETVFGIPELFVRTNRDYNVAARSIFDFIMKKKEDFSYTFIAQQTSRHHSTVFHSVANIENFRSVEGYKDKYESIVVLYAKYKSNTTN